MSRKLAAHTSDRCCDELLAAGEKTQARDVGLDTAGLRARVLSLRAQVSHPAEPSYQPVTVAPQPTAA